MRRGGLSDESRLTPAPARSGQKQVTLQWTRRVPSLIRTPLRSSKRRKSMVCFSNLKDGVYKSIRHFFLLLTRDMSKQLGDINRSLARAHRTLEHENDALIVLKDKLETAVDRNTGSSLTGKAWMAFDKIKRALGVRSEEAKRSSA